MGEGRNEDSGASTVRLQHLKEIAGMLATLVKSILADKSIGSALLITPLALFGLTGFFGWLYVDSGMDISLFVLTVVMFSCAMAITVASFIYLFKKRDNKEGE
jgi:hypothetical protein